MEIIKVVIELKVRRKKKNLYIDAVMELRFADATKNRNVYFLMIIINRV